MRRCGKSPNKIKTVKKCGKPTKHHNLRDGWFLGLPWFTGLPYKRGYIYICIYIYNSWKHVKRQMIYNLCWRVVPPLIYGYKHIYQTRISGSIHLMLNQLIYLQYGVVLFFGQCSWQKRRFSIATFGCQKWGRKTQLVVTKCLLREKSEAA